MANTMTQITKEEKRIFQLTLSRHIQSLSDMENRARKDGNTEYQLTLLNDIHKYRDLFHDLCKR